MFGGVRCTRDDWSTCPSDRNITITTTIVSSEAITARKLWPRDTVDVHVRSDGPHLLEVIDHRSGGQHGRISARTSYTTEGLLPEAFVTKIRLYVYDRGDNPTSSIDRPLFSGLERGLFD